MSRKLPSGRWQGRARVGGLGESRTFRTKRDADAWETTMRTRQRAYRADGVDPDLIRLRVSAVAEAWLPERKVSGQVKPSSFVTDQWMLKHLTAELLDRPIGRVTKRDIERLYVQLREKGLAASSVTRVHSTLSAFFSWAESAGYVGANPCDHARRPRLPKQSDIRPFLEDEIVAMRAVQSVFAPEYADIPTFAFYTGGRSGEIRALRVRDLLDLPFPRARFPRSAPDSGGEIVNETKGRKPRTVPLGPVALEIAKRRAAGKGPDDLLFTTLNGGLISHRNLLRRLHWHKTAKHEATSMGHRFHDLRHGAAVRWLLLGIDAKTVQEWMGHASAAMTLDRYAHYLGTDADRAALARLVTAEAPVRGHDEGTTRLAQN